MSRQRKTEEDIRLDKRVAAVSSYYYTAMQYLEKNPDHTCYIVLSNDDYGNNFEEDTSVYVRTIVPIEEVTEGTDSKYFTWVFSRTTEQYFRMLAEANALISTTLFLNTCSHVASFTPIGHRTPSGNIRKGHIAIAGIMLSERARLML